MPVTQGYLELSRDYQRRIARGELQVGMRLPSVRELSRLHQVSLTTAQRAVANLQTAGYIEARGRHGCRVVDAWTTTRKTIGIAPGDATAPLPQRAALLVGWNPVDPGVAQPLPVALERILSTRIFAAGGSVTHFVHEQGREESPVQLAKAIAAAPVDTLLALAGRAEWRAQLALELAAHGKSCIAFSGSLAWSDSCDSVGIDDAWGLAQITQRLCAMGHRRIAFAGYRPDNPSMYGWNRIRLEAWRRAMTAAGLPAGDEHVCLVDPTGGATIRLAASKTLREAIGTLPSPTALVCANDDIAVAAIEALRQLGRRVPEDVSVTGYDNLPENEVRRELTTVTVSEERVASAMLALAADRIAGRNGYGDRASLLVRPILVPRSSWRALSSSNPSNEKESPHDVARP